MGNFCASPQDEDAGTTESIPKRSTTVQDP